MLRDSGVRHRTGAVLLEVIVALVLLAIAGMSAIGLARQAVQSVEHARAADAELRAASAFLDVAVLWPRSDYDLRLGGRRQGPWTLYIDHPAPSLYRLAISDSTGKRKILETAVFRPVPASVDAPSF